LPWIDTVAKDSRGQVEEMIRRGGVTESVRWRHINQGMELREKLSFEVAGVVIAARERLKKKGQDEMAADDPSGWFEHWIHSPDGERFKMLTKLETHLYSSDFKNCVMKEAAELFSEEDFTQRLNLNQFLLPCQNGVIDLRNEVQEADGSVSQKIVFRPGKPDDYMSFMVGRNVTAFPAIVKRMVDEGHEVANHSWSHPLLTKMSQQSVESQLQRTHEAIVKACGVAPQLYRPPYGAVTLSQRARIQKTFGYPSILWDVDPLDWQKPRQAQKVYDRVLANAKPGSIILCHDIHESTIAAMPAVLDDLKARGYAFATVTQLINLATPQPPAATPSPTAEPTPQTPVIPSAITPSP
jgi:hypothetical protein